MNDFRDAHENISGGSHANAIEKLRPLIEKHPECSSYWESLGFAYGKAGQHEESLYAYVMAEHTRTCRSKPLHALAKAFLQADDKENAKLALRELYQLRPELVEEFSPQL